MGSVRVAVDLATSPSTSLDKYLAALKSAALAGYLNCGFPQPQVQIGTDLAVGNVVLTISEGPRYNRGGAIRGGSFGGGHAGGAGHGGGGGGHR